MESFETKLKTKINLQKINKLKIRDFAFIYCEDKLEDVYSLIANSKILEKLDVRDGRITCESFLVQISILVGF